MAGWLATAAFKTGQATVDGCLGAGKGQSWNNIWQWQTGQATVDVVGGLGVGLGCDGGGGRWQRVRL